MLKRLLQSLLLTATLVCASVPVMAASEPSLHEVYQMAEKGRTSEALTMMDEVLKNHPDSAKAHFVEAELLTKQGRLGQAASELSTAERLQPGLAFAKPEAVSALKARLTAPAARPVATSGAAQPASGLPWGLLLGGLVLILFIWLVTRFMQQRNAQAMVSGPYNGNMAPVYPAGGPAGYGPAGYPQPGFPAAGGGLGTGIMGGLATGAAVGAGIVAGEALARHFTDPERGTAHAAAPVDNWNPPGPDLGGQDFGVNDGGSWDSGGSMDDNSWN